MSDALTSWAWFWGHQGIPRVVCFLRFYLLLIFRERGREGERGGEKHQCVVASRVPCTEDLACNPGMCPDWESNQWPFGSQPALSPLSYTSQGPECFKQRSKVVKFVNNYKCAPHLLLQETEQNLVATTIKMKSLSMPSPCPEFHIAHVLEILVLFSNFYKFFIFF